MQKNKGDGGERGIRTPDTRQGILAFEASAFNHSAISPLGLLMAVSNARSCSVVTSRELYSIVWKLLASFLLKEVLQDFRTLVRQHSGNHFHLMIQSGMVQHLEHRTSSAGFRVAGAVYQTRQTRVH